MRYCFDIDGTLCDTPNNEKGKPDYINATPIPLMVETVNRLYCEGHHIIMMTARGRGSGIDHTELTRKQLDEWGYMYHHLEPMFHKPTADLFVDDKGIEVTQWIKTQPLKKGIIGGAFDLIHPGYIRMFKQAKKHCNHLTVALHENPSLERSFKLPPVQSVEDRKEILESIIYIDDIVVYQWEDTFLEYLKDYDIRFLGEDYRDGSYTGKDNPIDIVWLDRKHEYSTTKLKTDIYRTFTTFGDHYD